MAEMLTEVPAGADREAYWPLLLLADEAVAAVRGYYQQGTLFGFCDPDPVGHVLVIPIDTTTAELKSVAVVGTGNAGVGQLAFYQRAGFRMWKVERDFFSPERGYVDPIEENGIRILDMVWLDRGL